MKKLFLIILILYITSLALAPGQTAEASLPESVEPQTAGPGSQQVVIVEYDTPEELAQAAARLDIWEVNHAEGWFVALVDEQERTWLLDAGYTFTVDAARSAQVGSTPGLPCYRSITTLYTDIQVSAATYPELTQLTTIGFSYENRPVYVIRLTNEAIGGTKPRFFLMANIHGREMITPEIAMRFMDMLLDGYGVDPTITGLLDWQEVHIVVSANPDGHVRNEDVIAYWRKNTHPYGSCSPDSIGVDLNRNHSFKWGGPGASTNPCDETYRGPSAASEIETTNIQNYVTSIFPDQRGPLDTDPAPATATGALITLHSYSNLVLWPWGHTTTPAPNAAQLAAFGTKMATYNGYTPQQSVGLYPTSGSTDDWSYGELGIASYTFEVGSSSDGFFPSCLRYNALVQPNLQALLYAAKVSRTPYQTSFGPDTFNPTLSPGEVIIGWPVTLTATINDTQNGNKPVTAAEYYIDTPPWAGGTAHPLTASDGAFNSPVEAVTVQIDTSSLDARRHNIFVRGQDSTGFWGPFSAVFLDVNQQGQISGMVTSSVSGSPIGHAEVQLEGPENLLIPAPGTYAAMVTPGVYTVTASAFGYTSQVAAGVVLTAGENTVQDFALDMLPSGTLSGTVYELGSNQPLTAHILVEATPASVFSQVDGSYSLVLPQGMYTLSVSAPGHTSQTLINVQVFSGETQELDIYLALNPCVLVVDDDYFQPGQPYNYESYVIPALQDLGYAFDVWDVHADGALDLDLAKQYHSLLWLTGNDNQATLTTPEQILLADYLLDGRTALISGQNIAEDIFVPGGFLENKLKASFVSAASPVRFAIGLGPFAGLNFALEGGEGANNQTSPDVIASTLGSSAVFSYTQSTAAAVGFQSDAYSSLFFGFGLEGIASEAARQQLLTTSLDWLGCSPASIDLRAQVDGPAFLLNPGAVFSYQFTLENYSSVPLDELTVSGSLPEGLTLVEAIPAAEVNGNTVTWEGLSLAPRGEIGLELVVQLNGSLAANPLRLEGFAAQAQQIPAPLLLESVETILGPFTLNFLPLVIR